MAGPCQAGLSVPCEEKRHGMANKGLLAKSGPLLVLVQPMSQKWFSSFIYLHIPQFFLGLQSIKYLQSGLKEISVTSIYPEGDRKPERGHGLGSELGKHAWSGGVAGRILRQEMRHVLMKVMVEMREKSISGKDPEFGCGYGTQVCISPSTVACVNLKCSGESSGLSSSLKRHQQISGDWK